MTRIERTLALIALQGERAHLLRRMDALECSNSMTDHPHVDEVAELEAANRWLPQLQEAIRRLTAQVMGDVQ